MHVCIVTQSYQTLCDPMDSIAHEAPLSMGFSKQEPWNGLPFPTTGDVPDPGIKLSSPASQVLTGVLFCFNHFTTWEGLEGS